MTDSTIATLSLPRTESLDITADDDTLRDALWSDAMNALRFGAPYCDVYTAVREWCDSDDLALQIVNDARDSISPNRKPR